ncbi:Cys-tRNA(Pro) deacylase [Micrococcus sp.]|uniref:Cys-tRNA(Pro) deacylase n=1 Tax=Micrococcus sp. TaxID=1271 RepID=UPI002A912B25|nr:Cys-tRNA(Pro) deacylase [Micrococcus sp.]MDY6054784.1 Cys-tRNA(Pro) deacylase [Micrococcus sp.]
MAKKKRKDDARHSAATPAVVALEKAGVPHTVHAVQMDVSADEEIGLQVARSLGAPAERVFKTLMVTAPDGALAACVVPVTGHLDLRAAASALGVKKVAMADLAVAERRTGYVRGGISPLGQRNRHPVVVDASALEAETVYVSAGQRGLDLELAPADLVAATGAVVAEIATD